MIGEIQAVDCTYALQLKNRLGLDDSTDVVPGNGVAGLAGIRLTTT